MATAMAATATNASLSTRRGSTKATKASVTTKRCSAAMNGNQMRLRRYNNNNNRNNSGSGSCLVNVVRSAPSSRKLSGLKVSSAASGGSAESYDPNPFAGAEKAVENTLAPFEKEVEQEMQAGAGVIQEWLEKGLGSVILLAATAVSLTLANLDATSSTWLALWDTKIGPAMGHHGALTLRGWVNEGLMALFFFVVGLEIKRECVHGSLSSLKKAALPCLAALGGMVVPIGVYCAFNAASNGILQGWAIPMATDIAFAMGIYGFFRNRMPGCVSAFLLTLATVDDLGAILVIALFFAGHINPMFLGGAVAISAVMLWADQMTQATARTAYMLKYMLMMAGLWYCLLIGGINADVAGVVTALAIPAWAPAPEGSPAPPEHEGEPVTLIDHLVYLWNPWTTLIVMPLFALANTAVPIDASFISGLTHQPIALGIAVGLFVGKPIGITLFSLLGVKLKVAEFPKYMNLKHLLTVGVLGGIGFTMSLFLITLSLAGLDYAGRLAKVAIIVSSTVAAIVGAGMMASFPIFDQAEEDKKLAAAPAAA